jgi:SAM-dependent methyltransferase
LHLAYQIAIDPELKSYFNETIPLPQISKTKKYKTHLNMSSETQNDKKPLGFEVDGFDWNEYISHRPAYTPSLYEKLYTHHASLDGNVFDVAHDVGAGPGIIAERLASKFNKVVVSEPNPSYLNVAKHRLSSLPHSTFEFHSEKAEESSVESASIDLVVVSMSIHWTDVPVAANEFARQLKSGGTLYIVNYGYCVILDNPKANAIYREIVMDFLDKFQTHPDHIKAIANRAVATLSCGFDDVGFDEHLWKNVRRVFVNSDGDNSKLSIPARFPVHGGTNKVGENEERIFVEGDDTWFTEGCDLEWFKKAFTNYMFGGKIEDSKERWTELEEALGGEDKKYRVLWPSLHIFATKI